VVSLQQIARALNGEIRGKEVLAPGPGHSARDRSLSVALSATAEGGLIVKSFANNDWRECKDYVLQKLGLPKFQPRGEPRRSTSDDIAKAVREAVALQHQEPKSKPVASYDYTDSDGTLLYQVLRYEPKRFQHRQPDGHGGWIYKGTHRRVLYRWPELLKYPDATVFVCEGEKDSDNVRDLGLCATAVASGKWTDDCVQGLAGRHCWILEDNDEAGREKALAAAKLLHPVASSVKIIRFSNLPGHGDVSDWLNLGHTKEELETLCAQTPDWQPEAKTTDQDSEPSAAKQSAVLDYRRHRDANNAAPRYLIKDLLPENGVGLLAGQSGTFKTFVAIKLAGAVGMARAFAGHVIKRQGAVLFFAGEGAGELPVRLEALSEAEHSGAMLPIFYCDATVGLLHPASVAKVTATAKAVSGEAERDYKLPLVLIIFDTIIAAAQFAKSGDENDAVIGQKLMAALGEISRATGTFVLAIDHFGKAVETGTRGTSAKEAAADVVLALLANKSISGEVTNPRLCVRKRRGGPAGIEHPFTTKRVHLGYDEDGAPITSLAIDFITAAVPADLGDGMWTRSLSTLRRILMALLADAGMEIKPFADGPSVRAIRSDTVRAEFYRQYATADSNPKKQQEARKKAYGRSVRTAQDRGLLNVRELDGVEWLWLAGTQK
jgi:hypothetical protein